MSVKSTKTTLIKIKLVLEGIKNDVTIKKSCNDAGLDRSTFYKWLNQSKKNYREYEKVLNSRTMSVEDSLFNNCLKGNFPAQKFWLCNRAPEKWKDRTEQSLDHRSSDGSMSHPSSVIDMSQLTNEELDMLENVLTKKKS